MARDPSVFVHERALCGAGVSCRSRAKSCLQTRRHLEEFRERNGPNALAHGVLVDTRVNDGQPVEVQIRKCAAHAGRDPGRVRSFDLKAMAMLSAQN